MTFFSVSEEIKTLSDRDHDRMKMQELIYATLARFHRLIKRYTAFNFIFWLLMALEFFYIFFNLVFLAQSFVLAMSLALAVATCFFYLTLKVYFQTKKVEDCHRLKNSYLKTCYALFQDHQESIEKHELAAIACCELASALHGKEYTFYSPPHYLEFLASLLEKISCRKHWQDVQTMREILLQRSVEEHIKIVIAKPTDLAAHAGLANAYVMLAGLYVDPRAIDGYDDDRWIPSKQFGESYKIKFRQMSERAIEEFKILNDYAPDDPWVHSQLAYSYHDLQMPQEEIKEYEILLHLCPHDHEILSKLGKLYFQQGFNAKGLKIYEQLMRGNYKKAENLIQFYGAYI